MGVILTTPLLTFLPMDQNPSEVDTNPKSLEKWLNSLNFSQSVECARIILDVLQKTNRIELNTQARQHLMEIYLAAFEKVLIPLKKELEHPAVLSNSHGRLAITTIELLLEALFTGFRLCLATKIKTRSIKTRMNSLVPESDQGKIVLANTALMCARQLVNWAAQYHTSVPKGVWLCCHELYALICHYGWQDSVNNEKITLSSVYRQILLIAMLPSDRLNFASFEWMRNLVLTRETLLSFSPIEKDKKYKGAFYFETKIDSPPCFLRIPPKTTEDWQVINADAINKELQLMLLNLERSGAPQSVEMEWLRILLMEWSQPSRRSHVQVDNEKKWVQTQLSCICSLLKNKNIGNELHDENNANSSKAPVLINQINESNTSLMLEGNTKDQIIRVGELILCSNEDDKFGEYCLAWIRWFVINDGGKNVKFGVELIGAEMDPVNLINADETQDKRPLSALLLPPKLRQGRGPLLIIPGRQFSRMKELIMLHKNGQQQSIRLMTLNSQTQLYQLVGFLDSEDL